MRLRTAALATCVAIMILMTAPSVTSQGEESDMSVKVTMSITGLAELDASGSARFHFTGQAAVDLRHATINNFDTPSAPDQSLNADEVRDFMVAVAAGLEGNIFWGILITSATNFTEKADSFFAEKTDGLVLTGWDTDAPMEFEVGFSGETKADSKVIEIGEQANSTFAGAIFEATGYRFSGSFSFDNRVSTYTLGSYANPELPDGSMSALRLPWGQIVWYSYDGQLGPGVVLNDTATYHFFSVVENQMVGIAVTVIGVYLILRTPGRRFDKFEKLHPRKFRKYAKPLLLVDISAYSLSIALIVLYLFPFMFSFSNAENYVYTAYLYGFVILAIFGELLFSKVMYARASAEIPEESVIEVKQAVVEPAEGEGEFLCKVCFRPIEAGLDLLQCTCGATMHVDCGEKAQTCPVCSQPLVQLQTRSVQCRACGETFLFSGEGDAYSIQCTKCGAFQEEIAPGKNYLVVDEDARNAYMMIRAMSVSNRPAMIATTSFPGKIRSDYDMHDVPIKWFSDSSTDIDNVNPKDLDGDAMESISTFLMTTKNAGVLLEGIESLSELNGFEKVLAFVKKLNDLAAIHSSTIIAYVNKSAFKPEQMKTLSDEFDEIHDYQ